MAGMARPAEMPLAFNRVDDGGAIPDRVLTCLAQDQQGFIWLGTAGGLLRYDGFRFQRFASRADDPSSLPGNLVRSILVASDGRIWVGTDVDGLAVMDPASGKFRRYQPAPDNPGAISPGALFALAEDAAGGIWVGSVGGGLDYLPANGERFEHHAPKPLGAETAVAQINALLVDGSGRLWVGSSQGLYWRSDNGPVVAAPIAGAVGELIGQSIVYSLMEDADGAIWVGSREGRIFRLQVEAAAITAEHLNAEEVVETGVTHSAYSMVEVGDRVWVGLQDGIELRDRRSGQIVERVEHAPGVAASPAGSDLRALLVDSAGLVWAGGFGAGLQWHDPGARAVSVLRDEASAESMQNNVTAVLQRRNGEIWLGTRGAGIRILSAGLDFIRQFKPGESELRDFDVAWVTALEEAADGAVWVGTREGLRRVSADGLEFTRVIEAERPAGFSVRRLLADPEGAVWIGARDGLMRYEPSSDLLHRVQPSDPGVLTQDINALQRDAEGVLWVGAVGGLFQLPPGEQRLRSVPTVPGGELRHRSVLGLLIDKDNVLWVDTPQGLHRMRRDAQGRVAFEPIRLLLSSAGEELRELDGDFGANLLQDGQGHVWSQRYRYDPSSDQTYVLTKADGVDFGTGWYRAYTQAGDGRLLFGGSEGLLVIDPERFRPWSYQAPLRVTEWRVRGQIRGIAAPPDGLRLQADDLSFAVEFAALDFTLPEATRYRYRLTGFDSDWNAVDARYRVASYSNLWPGDYWLEVQGSNRTGRLTGQELRLPITVLPAWWQTPWALLLLLAGLTALGFALVRWRTHRVRMQALGLRRLVDSQTAELRQSKLRAEAALEELLTTQKQLVQSEKLAALGQLVAGVAHEVNTPLGVALTAASHLADVTHSSSRKLDEGSLRKSELQHWQQIAEESLRMILRSLERASDLVSRFKQLASDSRQESAVMMDLQHLAGDLADAARVALKDQAVEVQLSTHGEGELRSYPGALFKVITQLAYNAGQHAFPEGGGRFSIDCRLDQESLILSVADNGIGMSAETVAHAFDPFFTTRRSQGAGLGLHMVHNTVCRGLLGSIELTSALGEGSRFVIRLPRWISETSALPDDA